MKKALIIYGSSTGNTEFTAETIEAGLSEQDYEVTTLDVSHAGVDLLETQFDLYFLGCSTWGEDEIELQDDFQPFFLEMTAPLSLKGKSYAVFGCGDSSYTYFCGAVDEIEARVQKLGANLIVPSLRIDGDPEDEEIREWVQDVIHAA